MRVINLATIDETRFKYSSVAASSLSEYDSGTTYATGDKVKVSEESDGSTERRPVEEYESLTDSNTDNYPPDSPNEWDYLGATNRWAMFDKYSNTQSVEQSSPSESLEVEIVSDNTDNVGLFRLEAGEVELSQIVNDELMSSPDASSDDFTKGTGWTYDSTNNQYDCDASQSGETKLYQTPMIKDGIWYQIEFTVSNYSAGSIAGFVGGTQGTFVSANGTYTQIIASDGTDEAGVVGDVDFNGSIDSVSAKKVPSHTVIDLKNQEEASYWYYYFVGWDYTADLTWQYSRYLDATLRVTIRSSSGCAACGNCKIGTAVDTGLTQYDASIGIIDYSKKETDADGRTYLNQGPFAKRVEITTWINNAQVDRVRKIFETARGIEAIFDCNNATKSNYKSLLIYGYYKQFDINIPGPTMSQVSINIRGLT